MIVRARTPLRLGMAGGGTDVSPYSDIYGGCVLNATINMYAYCTIESLTNEEVEFVAQDVGLNIKSKAVQEFNLDGTLNLHKAVYNRIVRDFNDNQPIPVRVVTFSDAPPGSGLGSSSTMVVTILTAFREFLKLPLGEYDIAHLAYEIERIDCALAGGKQDQYAATFGGFNYIEFFDDDRVIVNPLRIREEIINELESHIMLYYTGTSRDSAQIIEDQIRTARDGDSAAQESMHKVKETAVRMKEALLRSNVKGMAEILRESWDAKKNTSKVISNPHVENIYETAINAGALSAKLSGAGGGGFMMLFVEPTQRLDVARALSEIDGNGSVYKFQFTRMGARSWVV